jgi:hypothetical protein
MLSAGKRSSSSLSGVNGMVSKVVKAVAEVEVEAEYAKGNAMDVFLKRFVVSGVGGRC